MLWGHAASSLHVLLYSLQDGSLAENGRYGGDVTEVPGLLPWQVLHTEHSLYGVGKKSVLLRLRLSVSGKDY